MTEYRCAKILQGLLACLAVGIFIAGILAGATHLFLASRFADQLTSTKSLTTITDTHTIGVELAKTRALVAAVATNNGAIMPTLPVLPSIPDSSSAALTTEQLDVFIQYAGDVSLAVAEMKKAFLHAFNNSIDSLIDAAGSSLSTEPENAGHVAPVTAKPVRLLFHKNTFSNRNLETLENAMFMLRDRASFYTPSPEAQRLTDSAYANLASIKELMENQLYGSIQIKADDQNAPAEKKRSKAQLVAEFMELFRECRNSVQSASLTNWNIDAITEDAIRKAMFAREEHKRRILDMKSGLRKHLYQSVLSFIASLVIGCILLACRDIIRAIINTAQKVGKLQEL